MKVVYSLKEEIKENSSNNHTSNEKGTFINFQSASLENVEANNNKLKGLLEKKDNEIKEKDATIESLTNDMKSFESYKDNLVGVSDQSKTINSPDFDIGNFMDEVMRNPLNNAFPRNKEGDDSRKERKIKAVKDDDISNGKLANETDIPYFLTSTSSLTQSPTTPNTFPSDNFLSKSPLLGEVNKKISKYSGRTVGRKASRPTRRVGNRVYFYK